MPDNQLLQKQPSSTVVPKKLAGATTLRQIGKRLAMRFTRTESYDPSNYLCEPGRGPEAMKRFMDDSIRALITKISKEYIEEGIGEPSVLNDPRLVELALRRIKNVRQEGVWDHYAAAYKAVVRLQRAELQRSSPQIGQDRRPANPPVG